jgi:NB-ARC domain
MKIMKIGNNLQQEIFNLFQQIQKFDSQLIPTVCELEELSFCFSRTGLQDYSNITSLINSLNNFNIAVENGLCIFLEFVSQRISDENNLHIEILQLKEKISIHITQQHEIVRRGVIAVRNASPIINNIEQYQINNTFIGRERTVDSLIKTLKQPQGKHIIAIDGIGGIGKTSLILHVVKLFLEEDNHRTFDAIIFTSSKSTDIIQSTSVSRPEKESNLTQILETIARIFNIPINQLPKTEDRQQIDKQQIAELLTHQNTLLIIDNLETLEKDDFREIIQYFSNLLKNKINQANQTVLKIVTTSRETVAFDDNILLDFLSDKDSIDLLKNKRDNSINGKIKDLSEDDMMKIIRNFHGHPLALHYITAKVIEEGNNIEHYIDHSLEMTDELAKFCFEDLINKSKEEGKETYYLLICMTLFESPPSRVNLIRVTGLELKKQKLNKCMGWLAKCNFIKEVEGKYHIIDSLRSYIQLELKQSNHSEAEFIEQVIANKIKLYLDVSYKCGGEDKMSWRSQYQALEGELQDIKLVLDYCKNSYEQSKKTEKFSRLIQIWKNIDCFMDLTGDWGDRSEWWEYFAKEAKKLGDLPLYIESRYKKAWTQILIGEEYHLEAKQLLEEAWDNRKYVDSMMQVSIANYLAILEKSRTRHDSYQEASNWLNRGKLIIDASAVKPQDRCYIEHVYYSAQVNTAEAKLLFVNNKPQEADIKIREAKEQLRNVMQYGKEIEWARIINYAENMLADILIDFGEEDDLKEAESLLKRGLVIAEDNKEDRRIALYNVVYAKLSYKMAFLDDAVKYAEDALSILRKQKMVVEQDEMEHLLTQINLDNQESRSQ